MAPLARGASGSAVQGVQSQLVAHGIQVSVDGAFGPGTQAGVTSFQSSAGLPAGGSSGLSQSAASARSGSTACTA
ncbi:peptidoglycan-binding protein [Kitasatospora sp. NPDC058190]|uniref:peptidoglycan-binding domain-containing protein n=1 Tax=Kitasatospora sp. NPDC058190 TaxID=3346371 RepID=UPI0036DBA55C